MGVFRDVPTRYSFKCKTDSTFTISNNQITAGKTHSSRLRPTRRRVIANNIIFTYRFGSSIPFHTARPHPSERPFNSQKYPCLSLYHSLFHLVVTGQTTASPSNLNTLGRVTDDVLNVVTTAPRLINISVHSRCDARFILLMNLMNDNHNQRYCDCRQIVLSTRRSG